MDDKSDNSIARTHGDDAEGRLALQHALTALQASASNFAAICIRDASTRAQYARDIQAVSREFTDAVQAGRLSAKAAAVQATALRNQIMDLSRTRSSPIGRAYATKLKQQGKTLGQLAEKYAARLFQKPLAALSETQQAAVYAEIVASSGRPDPAVMALSRTLGKIGRRLFLVSLAVATYEIYEAEDKPREVIRQGVLAGSGIAGGLAAGAGAVSAGICVATAPVCVGVAALVGGLLFTFGADLTFGTVYPIPAK